MEDIMDKKTAELIYWAISCGHSSNDGNLDDDLCTQIENAKNIIHEKYDALKGEYSFSESRCRACVEWLHSLNLSEN